MKQMEFMSQNNGDVVLMSGHEVGILSSDASIIDEVYTYIQSNFPEAYACLVSIYESSRKNPNHFKYLIAKRFIKCNFGKYDIRDYDIDEDGKWNLERVDCPLRGECPHENTICMPKRKNSLSAREMEIIALSAEGKTGVEIADILCISVWTVQAHIRNILGKLNSINIKQAITRYNEYKLSF